MRALIIEDEARAREHMKNLLAQHFPSTEVSGAVGSVSDAVQWLESNPDPDVIFMDVELSDGISFDIFNKVEINSPVIITTAYDQYAIQAFEVNAVDYLLKPIEIKDLKRAMARIASGEAKAPSADAVRNLLDQARKEKFLIRLNDRIVPVRVSDIAYFYSEDKNTYMVTVSGTSYVLDDSLDAHHRAARHRSTHGFHSLPRPRGRFHEVAGEIAPFIVLPWRWSPTAYLSVIYRIFYQYFFW